MTRHAAPILVLLAVAFSGRGAAAQTIRYSTASASGFTDTLAPTTTDAGFTAGSLMRSAAVNVNPVSFNAAYATRDFPTDSTRDATKYLTFTITPKPGSSFAAGL